MCSGCNVSVNSVFEGHNHIGRYSSIASNVNVVLGKHPTSNFVSMYPAFFSDKNCVKLNYGNISKFEEIAALEDIKWWENDDSWMIKHYDDFDNVEIFIKNAREKE